VIAAERSEAEPSCRFRSKSGMTVTVSIIDSLR